MSRLFLIANLTIHMLVIDRNLEFALGKNLLLEGTRLFGARHLIVNANVFANNTFERIPVKHRPFEVLGVFRIVLIPWVNDLPTQELCSIHPQWNRLENLNVFWIAVENRVRKNHIVTN